MTNATNSTNSTLSVLKVLYILSGLTVFAAIFIPVFYIDFEIATEAQWGFQYFLSLILHSDMGLGLDLLSTSSLGNLWKGVFGIFHAWFLLFGCITIFNELFGKGGPIHIMAKSKDEKAVQEVFTSIRFRFFLLTAHFLFAFALCFFEINGKSFKPVTTLSVIPVIISLVIFGFACFKKNEHMKDLQSEKDQKEDTVFLLCQQLQLFAKYKEMFQAQILSDEEFESKKEELKIEISNIPLKAVNATEEQRIFILKQLYEMKTDSSISPELYSKIRDWLCEK